MKTHIIFRKLFKFVVLVFLFELKSSDILAEMIGMIN